MQMKSNWIWWIVEPMIGELCSHGGVHGNFVPNFCFVPLCKSITNVQLEKNKFIIKQNYNCKTFKFIIKKKFNYNYNQTKLQTIVKHFITITNNCKTFYYNYKQL
jgi:hypothetical protein